MALYIGVNYHPHDWSRERWRKDVELMKEAGFTTVRLGHLCWDSYEPEEGIYTFEWFDEVMDLFAEAGIGVVLDVSMHPAPRWVHRLCQGCRMYGKSGTEQHSLTRYNEDVDDPAYQKYALRFVEKIVSRYKDHPALFAFGLCNELGSGIPSYSPAATKRFQVWLKKKYQTIDELNRAWATQRWSRRFEEFEEVMLQENEIAVGPPEAWLDMRRFYSDGIGRFIVALKETIEKNAPGIPHSSNHYAEKDSLGFDYLKYEDAFVDYPGMGLYPGYESGKSKTLKTLMTVYMQRLTETGKPMWCLEFQTGSAGIPYGPYGVNRMHIFLTLIYRSQMVLGWTFRSMFGGEEQYLFGMLGHDGVPGPNYEEYKQTAMDFRKLEKYAFPYLPEPEIGVAYGYENMLVMQYRPQQYRTSYQEQVMEALQSLDEQNRDYNVVDLRKLRKKYKVLLIPGYVLMGKEAAQTIREFVRTGGTVVMTGYSSYVDETNKVFRESRPGYLSDVFGIRVKGFVRNNERKKVEVRFADEEILIDKEYIEDIELHTAKCAAEWNGDSICRRIGERQERMCMVSCNFYGKGKAYYLAAEADHKLIGKVINLIKKEVGLRDTLQTPPGVCGREIAPHQYFYVNTLDVPVYIPLCENGTGVLSGMTYRKEFCLKPYDGELIIGNKLI